MNFETWKEFYGWGFATISQLQQAVNESMITEAQYTEITGQAYPTPVQKPVVVEHPVVKPSVVEPVAPAEVKPAIVPTTTPSADVQSSLQ